MANTPQESVLAAIAMAVANYVLTNESGEERKTKTRSAAQRSAGDYAVSGRLQVMDARRYLSLRLRPR